MRSLNGIGQRHPEKQTTPDAKSMKSACLAILNYNGIHHLEHLLPTVASAVAEIGQPCPVIVLDNCSTGGDRDWVLRHHPWTEVVTAPRNDYLYSYNWLLARRTEDIVVLLNNDLRLTPGFLSPLLQHFDAEDVFSVGASSRDWENTRSTCGPAQLKHHHGLYYWDWDRERQVLAHTLFTSGGFMAVDRQRFLMLGGFNRLYYPGYGEDLDLCFRAWRRGWRCIFEPASLVYHRESGTFSHKASRLMQRSRFLFQWSSLPPSSSWLDRTTAIVFQALRRAHTGDPGWMIFIIKVWFQWRCLRRQFPELKVSAAELNAIENQIRSEPRVRTTNGKS